MYQSLLALHGIAGLAALIAFWIAAFARKGSPLHRRVGKAYLLAMIGIVVTAGPMAAIIGASGRIGTAVFLVYLIVITATSMWLGWRAIRRKGDAARFRGTAYLVVALLNILAAIATFAIGLRLSIVLLMAFSAVGLITGAQMLIRRARPQSSPRWWLREHYSAMLGCGVATHVAFLAIGFDRLIRAIGIDPPGWYHLIAWFLPLIVSVAIGWRLDRKYMPKRDAGGALPARA
jgi:hypothetical protein